MNIELLSMLRSKGVIFDEGLTEHEYARIKQEYNIEFPQELKDFYSIALPISEHFYNWREYSVNNIQFIKEMIAGPFVDVYKMAEEIDWCDDWGPEPNESEKVSIIRQKLENAPVLIPIFSHRYMPMICSKNIPIFSICNIDIIYYGDNLKTYFEIEFGNKKQDEIDFNNIEHVSFWSDLL